MPRGGKRDNAGRKAIDPFDPLTIWCAGELEKMLFLDPGLTHARLRRAVKRDRPADLPHQEILDDYYEKLRAVPKNERHALIADSGNPAKDGTTLDDIRYLIDEDLQGRRVVTLPPLSPTEIGYAYTEIARRGAATWGIRLTPRQVKRRVDAYKKAREQGLV